MTNIAAVLGIDVTAARPAKRGRRMVGVRGIDFTDEGDRAQPSFGHGPVFTDLNFVLDPDAATALAAGEVRLTLIPQAARDVLLTERDLNRIASKDASGAWVAARSREWLYFWQQAIGLTGFYPFDLVAAMYLTSPAWFACARVNAWLVAIRGARSLNVRPHLGFTADSLDSSDNSAFSDVLLDVDASIEDVLQ